MDSTYSNTLHESCANTPVVDERVHEYLLLDDLLELGLLVEEVAVVVVADHDGVVLRGQVQDEPILTIVN